MTGLKFCVQNELHRQAVKDLAPTIIAANGLIDYRFSSSMDGIQIMVAFELEKWVAKDKMIKKVKKSGMTHTL